VNCFGFLRTAVYRNGDRVEHAQLDWPEGGGIMLGSYKPQGPFTLEPGTFAAYVVCSDTRTLHQRVVRNAVCRYPSCASRITAAWIFPPRTPKATNGRSAPTGANHGSRLTADG